MPELSCVRVWHRFQAELIVNFVTTNGDKAIIPSRQHFMRIKFMDSLELCSNQFPHRLSHPINELISEIVKWARAQKCHSSPFPLSHSLCACISRRFNRIQQLENYCGERTPSYSSLAELWSFFFPPVWAEGKPCKQSQRGFQLYSFRTLAKKKPRCMKARKLFILPTEAVGEQIWVSKNVSLKRRKRKP